MGVVNKTHLLKLQPIKNMLKEKVKLNGVSHGLAEAGYDIRLKQDITFYSFFGLKIIKIKDEGKTSYKLGGFTLASAIEEFNVPNKLVGVVHDKSTYARSGLSVFNTVIEPGWKGYLTLELMFHKFFGKLHIKSGSGIGQVLWHELTSHAKYEGKYQNQKNKPTPPKTS